MSSEPWNFITNIRTFNGDQKSQSRFKGRWSYIKSKVQIARVKESVKILGVGDLKFASKYVLFKEKKIFFTSLLCNIVSLFTRLPRMSIPNETFVVNETLLSPFLSLAKCLLSNCLACIFEASSADACYINMKHIVLTSLEQSAWNLQPILLRQLAALDQPTNLAYRRPLSSLSMTMNRHSGNC